MIVVLARNGNFEFCHTGGMPYTELRREIEKGSVRDSQ
jgi:hypothetical protein